MERDVGSSGAEQLGHQALRQPDRLILIACLDTSAALLGCEDEELGRRVANETTRGSSR